MIFVNEKIEIIKLKYFIHFTESILVILNIYPDS
jgi:hypothetical protein